jgi:hypothetical protein
MITIKHFEDRTIVTRMGNDICYLELNDDGFKVHTPKGILTQRGASKKRREYTLDDLEAISLYIPYAEQTANLYAAADEKAGK